MYELNVKNHKNMVLPLTGNPNYTITKIDGLNPPKASLKTTANSTMDGSTINSVRVEQRNIVLYIVIDGDIEANRLELYQYFPLKKTVTLYFKNGSRDVFIDGTVENIECDLFAQRQLAQISIICPKPYFKAIDEIITQFSYVTGAFEFPFDIGETGEDFGSIIHETRKIISSSSSVETGLIIELYAVNTVKNPVVYDVLNSTHIALNLTMEQGDRIVINTNPGEKSIKRVRGGFETNVLGHIIRDSEWFLLSAGDNVFTYGADEGMDSLQVTITTRNLFEGV